jgi:hypothetical protein
MDRLLAEGIVQRDSLSFVEVVNRQSELVGVALAGRVVCSGDVLIRIDKKMEVRRGVRNRHEVRTRYWQYHAWVRARPGRPRKDLVRYDNAHRSGLHVHLFDRAGREVEVRALSLDQMPTLDAVIRHAVTLTQD